MTPKENPSTEPKEGIEKEFRRQFNDFPTSALWYIPVWNFIEKVVSDVKKASREEALSELADYCKSVQAVIVEEHIQSLRSNPVS